VILWHAPAVLAAGLAAGAINAVAGSGTLVTFPTLVAIGYQPLLANVSNTVGLVPGSAAALWAYRPELRELRHRLIQFVPVSVLGALTGGILLLTAPAGAFKAVVPFLIGAALLLVLLQPHLSRLLATRQAQGPPRDRARLMMSMVFAVGVYGGYFGAAQGIMLIGLLGTMLRDDLQRMNALKNALALAANGTAALLFMTVHHIDWTVAGLIAVGSMVGGLVGGRYARKLSPAALRGIIVTIGVVAIVRLLT
jgi:uncharacterized membrane protein YfcA